MNGRFILEGSLRIHWGIHGVIHLKENDDQRTVVTVRKRNSYRSPSPDYDTDDDIQNISRDTSYNDISTCSDGSTLEISKSDTGIDSGTDSVDVSIVDSTSVSPQNISKSVTLPTKLDVKNLEWDELDELLQVERKLDESEKMYQTMPVTLPSQSSTESNSASTQSTSSNSKTERYVKFCNLNSNELVFLVLCCLWYNKNNENSLFLNLSLSEKLKNTTMTEDSSKTLVAPVTNGTSEDKLPLLSSSMSQDDSWLLNSNHLNRSMSGPDCLGRIRDPQSPEFDRVSMTSTDICTMSEQHDEVVYRRPHKGSTAIKRRPGKRLSRSKVKRRCSINGHFYDRETSFFTPPHGSLMSVWVTSLVNTVEVINLILEKYKVESDPQNFALFVVRDNGGR